MPITRAYASAAQPGNAFLAGKNKIINGDFNINQRGFSSTTTNTAYGFDRTRLSSSGGTATYSAQTFTAGSAPVAGYEAKNFARLDVTGQSASGDYAALNQMIESVRTLANQTVTVSFWAKAASGTPKVGVAFQQRFGTSGSTAVAVPVSDITISTSWTRYSASVAIPSVSGKTITTSNDDSLSLILYASAGSASSAYTNIGIQTTTIDFWGVQVEAGSVATPFQTATGTLTGELAACMRYYERWTDPVEQTGFGTGVNISATRVNAVPFRYIVPKRVRPSLSISGTMTIYDGTATTYSSVASSTIGILGGNIDFNTSSGLTTGRPGCVSIGNTAYAEWSAEL